MAPFPLPQPRGGTCRAFRAACFLPEIEPAAIWIWGISESPKTPDGPEEGGDGALGWKPQSGLDVTTLSLENLLTDVMRQRGDTCAPVRAALVQLRVANGVK